MKSLLKEIIGKEQRAISYTSPEDRLVRRVVINSIELSTGRKRLEKSYSRLKSLDIRDASIWGEVFSLLEIKLDLNTDKLASMKKTEPLVVIANHPYGVADGMALGYVLSKLRDDFYLIVNEVLCREAVLGKYFLPIDFKETKEAIVTNIKTRKRALSYLKDGGALGIFPSGGVSTTPKLFSRTAVDLEWKNFVNKLVMLEGVNVLPIFFKGQNSMSFQVASHIHPNLRLALLLKELDRKRGKSMEIVIGDMISHDDIRKIPRKDLLPFLKKRTFELEHIL